MLLLSLLLSLTQAAAPASPPPPACRAPRSTPATPFVEKGTCPGECCTYREWTATGEVAVVAAPGSKQVVARVALGEAVTAETGEVHVTPLRACALRAHVPQRRDATPSGKRLAAGDVFWILSSVGEGYATLWVDGELLVDEVVFLVDEPCTASDEDCWARLDAPPAAVEAWKRPRWWVRVRTRAGVVGWVDNTTGALTGFDSCG
jgi:hypothetical protein